MRVRAVSRDIVRKRLPPAPMRSHESPPRDYYAYCVPRWGGRRGGGIITATACPVWGGKAGRGEGGGERDRDRDGDGDRQTDRHTDTQTEETRRRETRRREEGRRSRPRRCAQENKNPTLRMWE